MNTCMIVYNLVNNGIGKVVLTYSRELIRHGHSVTVLVGGPCEEEKVIEAEGLDIAVRMLPDKKSETIKYFKALRGELEKGHFDLAHIHGNSGMVLPELVIAKRSRVVAVACHCHNTGCEHPVLHRVLRPFVPRLCDCMFACSDEAGKWLFGDSDYSVLPNSFELDKFVFDANARAELRGALGIDENTYVLGNVARLNPEKNHRFLVQVFEAFHADHPDSRLMIVGGGPGVKDVQALVDDSTARDSILMVGNVDDPSGIYSSMDCFVFPSIHEGLGIVLVEAQLSGLECFVSSDVPKGACVSDRFHSLELSSSADYWAKQIAVRSCQSFDRLECTFWENELERFDIQSSYHILEDAYEAALARGGRK